MKNYVAVPALCLLACCSTPRPLPTAPPPLPAPIAQVPARTALPPPPAAARWEDWPAASGAWRYVTVAQGSAAIFAAPDGSQSFAVRCVAATQTIAFVRTGVVPAAATFAFTASSGTAAYAGQPASEGIVATTSGRDPFLDKLAFSRGKLVVAVTGTERLVLPAWAEVPRVIEDCR